MPVRTKRWNDPAEPEDGSRILVSRYRPRALPKSEETWGEWHPSLGPSVELHAAFYAKGRPPISWQQYQLTYRSEMRAQRALIDELARRVIAGETLTLLCSSLCERESRCHRSLLKAMIEASATQMSPPTPAS